MIINIYNLSNALNVIFHSSPIMILVWWYSLNKSTIKNEYTLVIKSSVSSILDNGNLYLIVFLVMAWLSMHILQETTLLGVNNVGWKRTHTLPNEAFLKESFDIFN